MSTTDLKTELELARNAYNLALEGSRIQAECEELVNALYAELQSRTAKTLDEMTTEELGTELVARIQASNYNLEASEVLEVANLIGERETAERIAKKRAEDAAAREAREAALASRTPIEILRAEIGAEQQLNRYETRWIAQAKRRLAKMEAEEAAG